MRGKKLVRKTSKPQAGFTLIELMIVIAIIGILAAVAIPNFLRARDNAQYTRCLESLSGIKIAEEMFITDNGVYTDVMDELAIYMIAGCTDPAGADCPNVVLERIGNNCLNTGPPAEVGDWNINLIDCATGGNCFGYQITGTANDRFACHICVCPGGYTPTSYALCTTDWPCPCS